MSLNNSTYTQSLGIPFTQYVTSSAGHALVSSSTYFNDTSDNLPRYKDAAGNVLAPLVSSSYAVTSSYALTAEAGGGTGAAVAFPWKFKDPTAAADPGSGHFRLNSVTASAITEIYVSDNTSNGIDASNLLNIIDTSTRIYLQQNDDASRALLFSVSSAPTDNTGWFTIPVTYLQGSQIPKKDKICGWILARSGSGGGTDTNFANTDLTFTGDRVHDTNGNKFYVSADGGGYNSNYIGFENANIMGGLYSSSVIASGPTYIQTYSLPGISDWIRIAPNNIRAIDATSNEVSINPLTVDMDFRVGTDTNSATLFVEGSTDRVGILKDNPNAELDVKGNAIISGSLTVKGTAVPSTGETLQSWYVSDSDAVTSLINATTTNGTFVPTLKSTQPAADNFTPFSWINEIGADTGTFPGLIFQVRSGSNAAVQNRDLFAFRNYTTDIVNIGTGLVDINNDTTITGSLTVTGTVDADSGSFNYIEADGIVRHTGDNGTGLSFGSDTVFIQGNTYNNAIFGTTANTIGDSILEQPLTVHGDSTFEDRIITTTTDNAITTAGTFNPTGGNRSYVTLSGSIAVTLADGVQGQLLHIYCRDITLAGTTTITPTNAAGFTSVAFDAIGETATLMFADGAGGQWYLLSSFGATVT